MTKLEELKAAYAAATPGEWLSREGDTLNPERIYGVVKVLSPDQHGCDPSDGERTEVIVEVYPTAHDEGKADAEFIALAHNLMPQLLEAVELLKEVGDVRDMAELMNLWDHKIEPVLEKLT